VRGSSERPGVAHGIRKTNLHVLTSERRERGWKWGVGRKRESGSLTPVRASSRRRAYRVPVRRSCRADPSPPFAKDRRPGSGSPRLAIPSRFGEVRCCLSGCAGLSWPDESTFAAPHLLPARLGNAWPHPATATRDSCLHGIARHTSRAHHSLIPIGCTPAATRRSSPRFHSSSYFKIHNAILPPADGSGNAKGGLGFGGGEGLD